MLEDDIRDAEAKLLTSEVRSSAEALDRLVSDDFVEFGSSGRIYGKRDVVAQALAQPKVNVQVDDFKTLALSPDIALATYRTAASLRSSIWRREREGWRIVFHQGTPVVAGS